MSRPLEDLPVMPVDVHQFNHRLAGTRGEGPLLEFEDRFAFVLATASGPERVS